MLRGVTPTKNVFMLPCPVIPGLHKKCSARRVFTKNVLRGARKNQHPAQKSSKNRLFRSPKPPRRSLRSPFPQGGHSHKKCFHVARSSRAFTKNVLRGGFSQKMSYAALAKTNTQHKNPQKIARFARQNLPGARFARHFAQKTHWLRQFAQKMFWPPRLRRASTKNFVGSDPPV